MPLFMICPRDLQDCWSLECRAGDCRRVQGRVLTPCEQCGDLHEPFIEPPLCLACYERPADGGGRRAR